MTKHISLIEIVKQSGKFNAVNVISNILAVPKAVIIATVLVPRDYGIISLLGLWSMYAGIISPGFLSARNREMAHLLGAQEEEKALRIQNVSHTVDAFYSCIPFCVILGASFLVKDMVLKIGFMLTAATYAISHLVAYWRGVNFMRQRFTLIAKADLIQSVSAFAALAFLIFRFKIYAVLAAPIAGALLAAGYYAKKGRIGYRFVFDVDESVRLFKIGISFSLLTFIYWGYRLIDKTIIAGFLSMDALGIYSYASVFIFLALSFLSDFGNVLAPVLWTKIAQADNQRYILKDVRRIVIYLAVITAVLLTFSQLGFYLLVHVLTRKFAASAPVFIILSCNLFLTTLVLVPSLLMQSAVINKQVLSLKTYGLGLGLNIIFDIAAIRLGYGILAIAAINVLTQCLVTYLHFYFIRGQISEGRADFSATMVSIAIPFLIAVCLSAFHYLLFMKVANLGVLTTASVAVQAVVWLVIVRVFYREFFSGEKVGRVIAVFKEFKQRSFR